ncbi:MAG TPA: type 4a pilus biogenesis protein PilO [Mycobacteriales bacterium]|nr:type 4a pilus biogenesis protein PilO [Mycobacteriales bacterium]
MTQFRRWTIGTAILVVVIIAAGWFMLAKPQKNKVADLHQQAAAQQQANAVLLTQISALQAEQKELPQQQLVLQKFSTEVPDNMAEPTLIRQLSSAANGAGVDLSAIAPGAASALSVASPGGAQSLGGTSPAGSVQLYQLPLSLSVAGTYANVESFFNSLERLPRAFLVHSFSLAPGSSSASGPNQLAASLSAAVFFAPGSAYTPPVVPTPQTTTAPAPAQSTAPTGTTATPPAVVSSIQASEPPLQVPNG